MKTTVEEIENYLENYETTYSNEMDGTFSMFRADVATIAKAYKKGEVFIYSQQDWQEWKNEQIQEIKDSPDYIEGNEDIDQQTIELLQSEINDYADYTVIVDYLSGTEGIY